MGSGDGADVPGAGVAEALASLLGQEAVGRAPGAPEGQVVVRPGGAEEVVAALRLVGEAGVPVYPVGGARRVVAPGVVLDLSRLCAVLDLSAQDMLAVAQAGVTLRALDEAAAAVGLEYPPGFLSRRGATLGGSLARGGARGPGHGPARDYALGVRAALSDGRLVSAGSRAIKNATGYNLTQLLAGSWGAFGVIVEATLRLAPRPACRRCYLVECADAVAATRAALSLAQDRAAPAAELLDNRSLEALRESLTYLAHPATAAALLVLVEGADEDQVAARSGRLLEVVRAERATVGEALSAPEAEALWEARRELPTTLAAARPEAALVTLALPLTRTAGLVERIPRLAEGERVEVALFGGVGAGCLEVAAMAAEPRATKSLCRRLVAEARAVGGQPVGVEGAGLSYLEWLDQAFSPAAAAMHRRVKAALDPGDVLRPAAL